MQRWLSERVDALFDSLLGLAVFALIAVLPVSVGVKVAVLAGLMLGLYALVNVTRWRVPAGVRRVFRRQVARMGLALLPFRSEVQRRPSTIDLPAGKLGEVSLEAPEAARRQPVLEKLSPISSTVPDLSAIESFTFEPGAQPAIFGSDPVTIGTFPMSSLDPCWCGSGKKYRCCHGG